MRAPARGPKRVNSPHACQHGDERAVRKLTYFLHHSYNWQAQRRVYWLKMKAQRLHMNGIAICIAATVIGAQAQPLVVHEWGTFTSLQDEAGRTPRRHQHR